MLNVNVMQDKNKSKFLAAVENINTLHTNFKQKEIESIDYAEQMMQNLCAMVLSPDAVQFFTENNLDFISFKENELSLAQNKTAIPSVYTELSMLVPVVVQMHTELSDAYDNAGDEGTTAKYKNVVLPNLKHWEDRVHATQMQSPSLLPSDEVVWFLIQNYKDTIIFNFQSMIFLYTVMLNGGATLAQ